MVLDTNHAKYRVVRLFGATTAIIMVEKCTTLLSREMMQEVHKGDV